MKPFYLPVIVTCMLQLFIYKTANSQNIAINNTGINPAASAMLDIQSTDKGLLIPQISLASLTDGSSIPGPAHSLLIYNTNAALTEGKGYYYNAGTPGTPAWTKLVISGTVWKIAGNTGTLPGTDFIGTTDARGLMFKTNNIQSGYIDLTGTQNTSLGVEALLGNGGLNNIAIGWRALKANTIGNSNVAIGTHALLLNKEGQNNIAIGSDALRYDSVGTTNVAIGGGSLYNTLMNANVGIGNQSLYSNTSGSSNIGIGANAGKYMTTESSRIILNSMDRLNKSGDTTMSPVYIVQDVIANNQRVTLNGKPIFPYVPSGAGVQALRIDSTGNIYKADTTTGGVPALTATQIAFGDGSNLQTSSSNYTVDSTNLKIKVPGINITNGYELGSSINYAEPSSSITSLTWTYKKDAVLGTGWVDGNVLVSLHDTLFSLGGWKTGPTVYDDIYYSVDDAATWILYTGSLPFACHTMVILHSPDGWIYMLGGDYLSTATQQKSVYRTRDLINWTLMTSDYGGGIRLLSAGVVDDFGNLYWMGGQSNLQSGALNDIWKSTDGGATWAQVATGITVSGNAFLGKNISNAADYFNSRVYVVGGGVYDDATLSNMTYTKKVHSAALSDLTVWKAENDLPFLGGRQYNDVVVWDGKLWSIGGYNSAANTDSVGYMNKAGEWTLSTTGISPTHAAGVGVHKDRLFVVLGNQTNSAYMLSKGNSLIIPDGLTVKTITLPNKTGLINVGSYSTLSETGGGIAHIIGSSIKAHSIDNQVVKTSADQGQWIREHYIDGISFHTNITGAAGTTAADTSNQRLVIDNSGNVKIGTGTPTSTLDISGSLGTTYTATDTGITLSVSHNVIDVTATGQTITLPAAAGITGREYTIKLTASGSCTVDGNASETIDGVTTYSLASQYKYVTIKSTGSAWIVIANN